METSQNRREHNFRRLSQVLTLQSAYDIFKDNINANRCKSEIINADLL